MKYAFINRHRRLWPISVQCRVLEASVAGYHQHFVRAASVEWHLGGGNVVRFLSKRGRRHMEHDMGRQPVAKLAQWLDAYEVSSIDGATITIGHRTRRLRCKS